MPERPTGRPAERPWPDIVHGVPPVPVSDTSTRINRTGSWKYIRPVYQDKVAPCNAACPVGIDIEVAKPVAQGNEQGVEMARPCGR